MGGRLLVYVVEPTGAEPLTTVVSGALAAGLADRERHGFNRFRLVLAAAVSSIFPYRAGKRFRHNQNITDGLNRTMIQSKPRSS